MALDLWSTWLVNHPVGMCNYRNRKKYIKFETGQNLWPILFNQRMKLDIKSVWTICPSTIIFVLPFFTFDLPSTFCQTVWTTNAHMCERACVITTQYLWSLGASLPHGHTASKCPSQYPIMKRSLAASASEQPAKQRKVKHEMYQKWVRQYNHECQTVTCLECKMVSQ